MSRIYHNGPEKYTNLNVGCGALRGSFLDIIECIREWLGMVLSFGDEVADLPENEEQEEEDA